MKDAVSSEQWHTVAELAHKMLPPSRHIGASGLTDLLRKIEESVKNNAETGTIALLANETFSEFEVIQDLINEQIAKFN
jgi:HPt (histidine-containing phosphotransfer) domain-containing protein